MMPSSLCLLVILCIDTGRGARSIVHHISSHLAFSPSHDPFILAVPARSLREQSDYDSTDSDIHMI